MVSCLYRIKTKELFVMLMPIGKLAAGARPSPR